MSGTITKLQESAQRPGWHLGKYESSDGHTEHVIFSFNEDPWGDNYPTCEGRPAFIWTWDVSPDQDDFEHQVWNVLQEVGALASDAYREMFGANVILNALFDQERD